MRLRIVRRGLARHRCLHVGGLHVHLKLSVRMAPASVDATGQETYMKDRVTDRG